LRHSSSNNLEDYESVFQQQPAKELRSGGRMPGVTLVNCFEVPAGREEEFFSLWEQVNNYMRTKPGYLAHNLHRSLASNAPFRFVNVAQWASVEDFQAAHDDGFRALVSQPAWAPFRSTPALYEVVHRATANEAPSH
jgi:heme-degrading monooxygenase HmoA